MSRNGGSLESDRRGRQGEEESAATTMLGLGPDPPAVSLHNFAACCQAQTLHKGLENAFEIGAFDTGAVIPNSEQPTFRGAEQPIYGLTERSDCGEIVGSRIVE